MKITINIIPKAQMRARHGRTKTGASVTYKAEAQRRAEDNLCAALMPYRPERPLEGPLSLKVTAYLPVPMSWSGKRISLAETGKLLPATKPDLDNLCKHICDSLTAIGFWLDDKQVVKLEAGKLYNDGAGPRWEIEIKQNGPAERTSSRQARPTPKKRIKPCLV